MMKTILLILGMMVSMSLSDISGVRDHPQQALTGFWELHLGEGPDRQHFIARFSVVNGDPACEIHAYVDGIKSSSEPASNIRWTNIS
jgi:hypothetical protein